MATVYLARGEGEGGSDRYVALKLTAEHLQDDPEFAHHLIEEAKLVANLRHPNVVPVLDVGEDRRAVFLVMEYVPGDTLGGLATLAKKAGAPLVPRIGLRILVDALAGLHAAHEHADESGNPHRLVHRDFSPQNILVGTDGVARLTDFGIAKAVSRASITVAGTLKGKISYASPEQVRGDDLDRRCDIWAAGIIAWELISGQKAYSTAERSLLDIVKGPPPRLRTVIGDVPEAIEEAVAYALQMAPEDRPATAKAFARMLASAAKKANLLAERGEVAAHVQQAAAPVLNARKEKITQTQRIEEAPTAAQWIDTTLVMPRAPLPSLPDLPMETITMREAPVLPPGRQSLPDAIVPSVRLIPRKGPRPRPLAELTSASSSSIATFSRTNPTGTAETNQDDAPERGVSKPPRVLVGGVAAAAGLLVIAGAFAVASMTTRSASEAASSPAVAPATLELSANAPIARVRIGERVIETKPPSRNVVVELTPDEQSARLRIVATSSDGRVAAGSWAPGTPVIPLTFADEPNAKPVTSSR